MPELPEVESYRRRLWPILKQRRIEKVVIAEHNYAMLSDPRDIKRGLQGTDIDALRRHGKYLLLDVARKGQLRGTMLIHLGMTGQIFSREYQPDNHVHMTLSLRDSTHPVYFRDVRKFGKLKWLAPGKESSEKRITRLGPDALEIEGGRLFQLTRKRKAPIKAILLDQAVFAGLGNIYADEALFAARVRPGRAGARISRSEADAIAEHARRILNQAIKQGGSSINDYVLPDGSLGYFQRSHLVYGREGQACRTCGTAIKRKQIAQRSTHYCPTCQER